jgi:disulfide bond formation protein DsbB
VTRLADENTSRPRGLKRLRHRLRERDLLLTVLACAIGIGTIAGAWGSQLIGGLVPCELCLEQRLAYYWGLPVLAIVLAFWDRLPVWLWYAGMGAAVAIFLWGLYIAGYHAGVEWGFWPGPTDCSGSGVAVDFSDLKRINEARVVPCETVQFRFLGISLAGYNALMQLAIIVLLALAMLDEASRKRGR